MYTLCVMSILPFGCSTTDVLRVPISSGAALLSDAEARVASSIYSMAASSSACMSTDWLLLEMHILYVPGVLLPSL